MPAPQRLAIYARISHDPDRRRLGVDDQVVDCCEAISRHPTWQLTATHVDNDISASDPSRPRPAYQRMLTALRDGQLDGIVAVHLDRLYRQPRELEDLIDLYEHRAGLILHTVQGADFDLTTSDGRAMARVTVAFAKKESEDKARRIRRRKLQMAQEGKPSGGGTRPFGYDHDRTTIRETEAVHVRHAVARIIAGETLRAVTLDLQRDGVRTPTGGLWQPSMLRRMLLSPRIAGLRQHQGEIIGDATWPGLVLRADWEQMVAILRDPTRRKNRGIDARRYLLPGFLYCSRCEQRMVARPRADKVRAYVCASGPGLPGCGRMFTNAQPVEDLIRDAVAIRLSLSPLHELLASSQRDSTRGDTARASKDLAEAEQRLETVVADYADGTISRKEFLLARERLTTRIEKARAQVTAQQDTAVAATLPDTQEEFLRAWGQRSLSWKRAVLDLLVDRVIVKPAVRGRNRFDPDRIDVTWKV